MTDFKKIHKGQILFRLLKKEFFKEIENLDEFIQKDHRAHGILIIKIDSLDNQIVAIPMRSSLKQYQGKQRYIIKYKEYEKRPDVICVKGLDLSKMLFITEDAINFDSVFKTSDPNEQVFYRKRFNQIFKRTKNYINKYINLCNNIDVLTKEQQQEFLKLYRFSTLRNFHDLLKISITKEKVKQKIKEFHEIK